MKDFIEGNQHLRLQVEGPQQAVCQLMGRMLKAQQYRKLSKVERGVVRRFPAKAGDLGRAQITRLISRRMKTRRIRPRPRRRGRFPNCYAPEDIVLLARRGALWVRAPRMRLSGTCPDRRCGASASGSTRCSATSRAGPEGAPDDRQRAGGRQELRGDPQALRPRSHSVRTCRSLPEVLHGAFQSAPELSPAPRVGTDSDPSVGQTPLHLPARGLPDALREVDVAERLDEVSETGD
jgi:hypothetical protein